MGDWVGVHLHAVLPHRPIEKPGAVSTTRNRRLTRKGRALAACICGFKPLERALAIWKFSLSVLIQKEKPLPWQGFP